MPDARCCHDLGKEKTMADGGGANDREVLLGLNRDYIASVQNGDVQRFDEILAQDFRCSNPDGSLLDRAGFLAQTARPVTISGLEALDVEIRFFGDIAIIHARTRYSQADGRAGAGRYTDVWSRQSGKWLCVSAHVTRC
jgi:ketosteroid isomerase-like protein